MTNWLNWFVKVDELLDKNFDKILITVLTTILKIFGNFWNLAHEKNAELVDLVKRFPTLIWTQKSALIQPRTDHYKFGRENEGLADEIWRIEFVRVTNRIDAIIGAWPWPAATCPRSAGRRSSPKTSHLTLFWCHGNLPATPRGRLEDKLSNLDRCDRR